MHVPDIILYTNGKSRFTYMQIYTKFHYGQFNKFLDGKFSKWMNCATNWNNYVTRLANLSFTDMRHILYNKRQQEEIKLKTLNSLILH